MRNNASLVYSTFLAVGDFLALVAAFVAAYVLRVSLDPRPLVEQISALTYLGIFLMALPFWIFIFAILGLYSSNIYEKRFAELGRLAIGSFIGLLFLVFIDFVHPETIFPARLVPLYGFALGFGFLIIYRNLARFVRGRLFAYDIGLTKILLIGNTDMTQELVRSLINSKRSGYKIVAIVGGKRSQGEYRHVPLFRSFEQFINANLGELHGIIQTELYADEPRNAKILTYAQENHIGYRFVPGNTELFVGNLEVELFRSGVPVITVHQTSLFGWGRVAKRLSDLVLGSIALVIASPFLLAVALAQKIAEPGAPIFYKPQRLGRFGGKVTIFKFRSMYGKYCVSPEEGFKRMGRPDLLKQYRQNGDQLPNDPRVTTIGRFLRKTSLDELPQLINVVRGDISFVGPRALDPQELANYSKKNLILAVKTGLTGLAQVSGRRNISFEERRKLDLYYVQNWSIWMDLTIIIKTIRVVLGGRGTN